MLYLVHTNLRILCDNLRGGVVELELISAHVPALLRVKEGS